MLYGKRKRKIVLTGYVIKKRPRSYSINIFVGGWSGWPFEADTQYKIYHQYQEVVDPSSIFTFIEIFTFKALEQANQETSDPFDREHVTPYLRKPGKFQTAALQHSQDLSALRWTVDEPVDFSVIEKVFQYFHPRTDFTWSEVLTLQSQQPELFNINQHIIRNEGALIGTGQKLWKRAKQIIPGGNMLLSKRAEMFLPDQWPAYFSKAKGCKVWDLDGKEYIDMSIMGVGTNTLGYGHPEVDDAVRRVVDVGNMSTLNCPEEV